MEIKKKTTLSKEIYPDIYKITLPLPFKKPGPVNTYLFLGEKITLLDTGLSQTANKLKKALAEHDLQFSDIEQIIITHGHIEHYGAAKQIAKASAGKTDIAVHIEDIIRVETGKEVPMSTFTAFLKQMGLPPRYRLSFILLGSLLFAMARNCTATLPLKDNDTIQLGNYQGTVISTPGHTKGTICIYLAKENILFSGDHILGHVTPNAFVMLEASANLPARLSQSEYYESLSKIKQLSPSKIFTGHCKDVLDLEETIKMYTREFRKRNWNILSILDDGEQSVYEISGKLFPEIKNKKFPLKTLDIFLSLSEVYTHLQVLDTDGLVSSVTRNKVLFFRKPESV